MNHIVSGCAALRTNKYIRRHDELCRAVHWSLCKRLGVEGTEKLWWKHVPRGVTKTEKGNLIWNQFVAVVDGGIRTNRPDIILETKSEIKVIEVSCPCDRNTQVRYDEKVQKYRTLITDMRMTKRKKVTLVPIVIGATGATLDATVVNIESLECRIDVSWLQKIVAIETVKLVRTSI